MRILNDDVLICRDCGDVFIVTGGERHFYSVRVGHYERPKLCRDCRIRRREQVAKYTPRRITGQ